MNTKTLFSGPINHCTLPPEHGSASYRKERLIGRKRSNKFQVSEAQKEGLQVSAVSFARAVDTTSVSIFTSDRLPAPSPRVSLIRRQAVWSRRAAFVARFRGRLFGPG
ncbi:hypothetical protein ZHAS_00006556 [Anopheles sinensis]|uniref:Uncharacterized protein n=1 Tax=Anopheles sinensis TaxID=74873 RepID=A0A084VMM1_ANOSI|nr:hypothetical protein ZHAS_00006556 [Anopheles sinensis]